MNFEEIMPFVRSVKKDMLYPGYEQDYELVTYDNCFLYVFAGQGRILVGNNEYDITKGSFLYWRPKTKYRYISVTEPLLRMQVHFDYTYANSSDKSFRKSDDTVDEFVPTDVWENIKFDDEPVFNSIIFLEKMFAIENCLLNIETKNKKREKYYRL